MRRPIIAGNWKMNMTPAETEALISALIPLVKDAGAEVVVCPPFIDLPAAAAAIAGTDIRLGAQNVHWAGKGAYTGEISADMLRSLGVSYAIVGHSERRQLFGETDGGVNKRARAALAAGITPIICVGETLDEREASKTEAIVSNQVRLALEGMDAQEAACTVIAYEPIWAIGTGVTASAKDASDTISSIRRTVASLFGDTTAEQLRIQYGGSMNPKNARELMSMNEIDGGLIGGASLKAEDFAKVVNYDND